MKTFIRNNSTALLIGILFVSLCVNQSLFIRTLNMKLWGATMKEHLFYIEHYRVPMTTAWFISSVLLTIMAGFLVWCLYRRQKRKHKKLLIWRWVSIIVIGLLSLTLPFIDLLYGYKIFLIDAVVCLMTMLIYLMLSDRKTLGRNSLQRAGTEEEIQIIITNDQPAEPEKP
ncbi:MAG: hypothetical protein LBG80_10260 [Bacteroidales bacterium]|nr:hypothetical protein [Bacteroidales bacterium]